MRGRNQNYRCWCCWRFYSMEELGRCMLPDDYSRRGSAVMRTICQTCYTAIVASWPENQRSTLPLRHGF